ncbi:MAG: HD domain-containing protein [Pirellulales bacterium]|nr:HD domain-containing protein [Pirellulales bacterium]
MSPKVFRDPLYNYISIDQTVDSWLVDVVNCREIQRLRRIHQLGVGNVTYPGADHNRLAHSLGVLHVMQLAVEHFSRSHPEQQLTLAKPVLLAAALVHDVGHGPFSHLFEPCLGIDHEEWSKKIILDTESRLHEKLVACDGTLPQAVADLIDPDNKERPAWQKYLISSQLDMDRLDYLRRDSLFTGAGYGHFDWHRLITTMELVGDQPNEWEIVWNSKAKFAIEEYVFARYYMYQNVYLHKTTRGFEQMLQAMWRRAKQLREEGTNVNLESAIEEFWKAKNPSVDQYIAIEEFTVLSQIQNWQDHSDKALSDLASRFLNRIRFKMIEAPDIGDQLDGDLSGWEEALHKLVSKHVEFNPSEMYVLKDTVKPKYNQPYFPEKETDEQSVKNAIRVLNENEQPVEVSKLLPRMRPVTEAATPKIRYYLPEEVYDEALRLRNEWV